MMEENRLGKSFPIKEEKKEEEKKEDEKKEEEPKIVEKPKDEKIEVQNKTDEKINTDEKTSVEQPISKNGANSFVPFVKINEFPKVTNVNVQAVLEKLGDYLPPITEEESQKNPIQGPFRFENDAVYLGQMLNNKREGRGKMIWADGSMYEGFWKNDMIF